MRWLREHRRTIQPDPILLVSGEAVILDLADLQPGEVLTIAVHSISRGERAGEDAATIVTQRWVSADAARASVQRGHS